MIKGVAKLNSSKPKTNSVRSTTESQVKSNAYKIECIEALQEGKKYKSVKSMLADSLNW